MPLGFDVMQYFVSASAVLGISYIWAEFTKKAIKTQSDLLDSAFSFPKKKDDSSSDSNDANVLNENDIKVDDDCSRESGLEIHIHISSPSLDEADVERLKHKGIKKALLEIMNSDPKKPEFGISVKFSSPFFDDADMERLKNKGFKKGLLELLNALGDKDEKKTE